MDYFHLKETRTVYILFQSRGFYNVPWVLIADARSFQALSASLDWLTHLADPTPDKMNLNYLKLLCCEFQKYKVMTISVVGGHKKKLKEQKHTNPSYKATKQIECTLLISDYH